MIETGLAVKDLALVHDQALDYLRGGWCDEDIEGYVEDQGCSGEQATGIMEEIFSTRSEIAEAKAELRDER